uniref:Pre-mRNA-splicing factor 38 n=1 Tax=Zea mays TaxID=4577 RepID=A0A804Q8P4_MAIZE
MTGNCRGPSSAFCLLYKLLFTMKLIVKQTHDLLKHQDSPYIRADENNELVSETDAYAISDFVNDETDDRPSMWEIVGELELILRMMLEEDLILLETSETYSTNVSKSSSSATEILFVSSQASRSLDASSAMISGRVTHR